MPWAGGLPLTLAGSQVPAVHSGYSIAVPSQAVDGLSEQSLRDGKGTPALPALLGTVSRSPRWLKIFLCTGLSEGLFLLSQCILLGHCDGS